MNRIEKTINRIIPVDKSMLDKTQKKLDNLTKPLGSLGRIEETARKLAAITGKEIPVIENKTVFTLAGDHGVTEENISAYPRQVTAQMVYNFMRGGAAINVLSRHSKAKVIVVDMGVAEKINPHEAVKGCLFKSRKIGYGTHNIMKGPAMSRQEAIKCIETGIELVEEELQTGINLIITGDMGIGNTTIASAITSVITGRPVEKVTGKGAGIKKKALSHKIKIIKKAINLNKPSRFDPVDVLAKIGGFEIGGLTGVILAGAAHRIPVLLDGFISTAAALLAVKFRPCVKEYLFAGHFSKEPGHAIQLKWLGLEPLLDLELRLGEGTGAALASNILEASTKILKEMATFDSAGISK